VDAGFRRHDGLGGVRGPGRRVVLPAQPPANAVQEHFRLRGGNTTLTSQNLNGLLVVSKPPKKDVRVEKNLQA